MNGMKDKDKTRLSSRVWEIDALRGGLILSVLFYHLYMTVDAFCINGIYSMDPVKYVRLTDPLNFWFTVDSMGEVGPAAFPRFAMKFMQPLWVDIFFVVSGISCMFSRNNLKSGLRLVCGAAFVSVFTQLLALYSGKEGQFIRFGVLHCYAACHLIYYFLLEDSNNRVLLSVAGISLLIGYYLRNNPVDSGFALLFPFGIWEEGVVTRDYWPIFPMLGWFLLGVVTGRCLYSEKKTRFPKQAEKKWHRALCCLGRYSGAIYCGHIVGYPLLFYGIGYIFKLY